MPQGFENEVARGGRVITMSANLTRTVQKFLALLLLLSFGIASPMFGKKKKDDQPAKAPPVIDYSNIVWPNPPAVARIRYQAFYAAQKLSQVEGTSTTKQKWMDRLAGTQTSADTNKVLFQLSEPYGMVVDSK